jgi:hypothetical protein
MDQIRKLSRAAAARRPHRQRCGVAEEVGDVSPSPSSKPTNRVRRRPLPPTFGQPRLQGLEHLQAGRLRAGHLVRAVPDVPFLGAVGPGRPDRVRRGPGRRRVAGFDDRAFYDLFEKHPANLWPAKVERLEMANRTAPFDAWLVKSDRIEY